VGPDGELLDEWKDEETTTIDISYASGSIPTTLIKGDYYDLHFVTQGGQGISATLNSCRLTGFDLSSDQSAFTMVTLTFSKKGAIDSTSGAETAKQTVTFTKEGGGTVTLGDYAYVTPTFQGNAKEIIVPTALGIIVQSTGDLGGGQLNIAVAGHVHKDTRLELEQYLINLFSQLTTAVGDLVVSYGASSYTISDCYCQGASPGGGFKLHETFTINFVKSAY